MNVFVGSLEDPVDREGMAHYLEHMLFLGTEKYPNQSEYMDYLSKNSGTYNAYTSLMETNYFFEVANHAFEGGLDRFAQFFIAPLFTESCSAREMNAVNSEHLLYFKQDIWREFQLLRHSAKKGNPMNKFGVGSLETLNYPNIREDLIKFFNKQNQLSKSTSWYYSSNQMKMVIYSNESIDHLQNIVEEKFSSIVNKNILPPQYQEMPFDEENQGQFWKVVPIKDQDELTFHWKLDHTLPYYKSNPVKYISHILGHEGENSLLSFLKAEGLALEISAYYTDYMNLFTLFKIKIQLTQKGLANPNYVVNAVFAAIQMLREFGVNERLFTEIQTISKLKFDNQDKQKIMTYVLQLASRMQYYNLKDVLIQPYLFEQFDANNIQKYIDSFQTSNLRIFLSSKSLSAFCNEVEPIYGTHYSCNKFSEDILSKFSSPDLSFSTSDKRIALPPPNQFLPKSMEIMAQKDDKTLPELPIEITEGVWFKQDNTFFTPKAQISLFLYLDQNQIGSAIDVMHAKLWEKLFQHYIREIGYLASQAYLEQIIIITPIYIKLQFKGFSDSLSNFVLQILQKLVEFDPLANQGLFNNVYDEISKETENFFKNPPYKQIGTYIDYLVRTGFHSPQAKVEAIKSVTFESFKLFQNQWLKNLREEWLIIGNIKKESALDLQQKAQIILTKLAANQIEKYQINQIPGYQFPLHKTLFWQQSLPVGDENSTCTKLYQHNGECTIRIHNLLEILQIFFKIPAFTQLRTVEQLGYIVSTTITIRSGVGALAFIIQSAIKPPLEISARIRNFVASMEEKVTGLSEEAFQTLLSGLKNTLKQKDIDIFAEAIRYEEAIQTLYQFDKKNQRIQDLDLISLQEFIKFTTDLLYNQTRSLEFYLVSDNHKEQQDKLVEQIQAENDSYIYSQNIETILSRLPLYPYFYSKK